MVSCALDTADEHHRCCGARAAMVTPLGDQCSLPCLYWIACVTLNKSWTSSKIHMVGEQQSCCCSCSGLGVRAEPALGRYPEMLVPAWCMQWPPLWPEPPNPVGKDNKIRQITALEKQVCCWLVPSAFLSLQILGGGSRDVIFTLTGLDFSLHSLKVCVWILPCWCWFVQ